MPSRQAGTTGHPGFPSEEKIPTALVPRIQETPPFLGAARAHMTFANTHGDPMHEDVCGTALLWAPMLLGQVEASHPHVPPPPTHRHQPQGVCARFAELVALAAARWQGEQQVHMSRRCLLLSGR